MLSISTEKRPLSALANIDIDHSRIHKNASPYNPKSNCNGIASSKFDAPQNKKILSLISGSAQISVASSPPGSIETAPDIHETNNTEPLVDENLNKLYISKFQPKTTGKNIYSIFSHYGSIYYFQIYYRDGIVVGGLQSVLIKYIQPENSLTIFKNAPLIKISGQIPTTNLQNHAINYNHLQDNIKKYIYPNLEFSNYSVSDQNLDLSSCVMMSTASANNNGIQIQEYPPTMSSDYNWEAIPDKRRVIEINNLPIEFQAKDLYVFLESYMQVSITFVFSELNQNGKRVGLAEFRRHWMATKICQDLNNYLFDNEKVPLVINFSNFKCLLNLYENQSLLKLLQPCKFQDYGSTGINQSNNSSTEFEFTPIEKKDSIPQAIHFPSDSNLPLPASLLNPWSTWAYNISYPPHFPCLMIKQDRSLIYVSEKNCRLYFRNYNISVITSDEELRCIFEPFGIVTRVDRILRYNNTPRGFSFIQFRYSIDGYRARITLDGSIIHGCRVKLMIAKECNE